MKKSPIGIGAIAGLLVGTAVLMKAYVLLLWCFKYQVIASADAPWYCAPRLYTFVQTLTFPIPVLTNDLANAAYYAPLTLGVYALLGALVGWIIRHSR